MTLPINDISRIVQYTATGGQTSFAIPFEFYSVDEIIVYVNGVQLTYSITPLDETEFSVTGVQVETGGNITLGDPGATLNDVVTVVSRLPNRRLTDFPVSGPFRTEELNEELDKIIIMIQQLDTFVTERMLLLEDYDEPDTMNRLPTKANRANKVLGFDADGQPTVSDGALSGGVPLLAGVTPTGDQLFYIDNSVQGALVDFTQFAVDFIDALSNLSDPGEDSVLIWDESANTWAFQSISSLVIAAGRPSTRTVTATTDTLVIGDAGNRVLTTNSSPVTITVPPLASVAYTEGDLIEIKQGGSGLLTIAAGAGVTIESFGGILTSAGQNATLVLRYEGSNVWQLGGEIDGIANASTTQTEEAISGMLLAPADQDYKLVVKIPHGGTITETTTIAASGTCTATFKVNTTALGGTANSVSSSEQSQAHASSNTFVAGDDIVVTISANASCTDLSFTIKYTRTLE